MEFSTSSTNHTYKIQATDLRLDPDYQYYYISWARAILLAFIPFLLLSMLNGKIIYQLRKTEVHLSRVRTFMYIYLQLKLNRFLPDSRQILARFLSDYH